MPVFTVHAPPVDDDGISAPEDFTFVRDGFYVWAMIFGPFWLLVRRLWLVLFLYVVVMAAIGAGLWFTGWRQYVGIWPMLFIAVLLGLEGGTLRRWTLSRRGFENVGIVVADNLETAERRFFDRFAETGHRAGQHDLPPAVPPSYTVPTRPTSMPPVIGLFPEPGAGR